MLLKCVINVLYLFNLAIVIFAINYTLKIANIY